MEPLVSIASRVFGYAQDKPLIFTEASFWIFFTILLAGYSFVYKAKTSRSLYLLIFSLFFYYKSSGLYFFLLIFSTICDYLIGWQVAKSRVEWKRKALVALSVAINLGVLGYFKYAYLFTDWVNQLLGTSLQVNNYVAQVWNAISGSSIDTSSIILPVGISFYTFQTISYTVDVYRCKVKPVKNIIDFGFYVSFFPQLVAGPIVRAAEFIPQLYQKYSLTQRELGHAIFLILNGLIKKVIISDYISINFVDRIFDAPLSYSGIENLLATYGYALQIYCDFSGYTDMAIGLALMLGFKLPLNFNSPYKATSITDFWHRWHISLSSWLRDYLYIPLGGNKKGSIRTYANLMVTMLLGGLWHGASIRFVVWGGIHGTMLALEKFFGKLIPLHRHHKPALLRFAGATITFHVVCLSWIFFRASSMSSAYDMLGQIFTRFGGSQVVDVVMGYSPVMLAMLVGFGTHWFPVTWKESIRGLFIKLPLAVKVAIAALVVIALLQVKSADVQPFIYFRF